MSVIGVFPAAGNGLQKIPRSLLFVVVVVLVVVVDVVPLSWTLFLVHHQHSLV